MNKCALCKREFYTINELDTHIKSVHDGFDFQEEWQTDEILGNECNISKKTFETANKAIPRYRKYGRYYSTTYSYEQDAMFRGKLVVPDGFPYLVCGKRFDTREEMCDHYKARICERSDRLRHKYPTEVWDLEIKKMEVKRKNTRIGKK